MTDGKMMLSREIPRRTKTIVASWCRKDFLPMSQKMRDVRSRMRDKMDCCYWCRHPFADGEMMALACFGGIGNKVLCQRCADDLIGAKPGTGEDRRVE